MSKINRVLWLWGPLLLWAGAIFYLSSLSSLPSADKIWWDFAIKKLAHIFEYAVLYFLFIRAIQSKSSRAYTLGFVFCIIYAISDEYHQSFTPGRFPKATDILYDTLGMVIAYLRLNHKI